MMRPAPSMAYLEKARRGDDFACPHCGTAGEPFHFENRPGVLRCRKCRKNTGLTVGTVMERSHDSAERLVLGRLSGSPVRRPASSAGISFSGNLVFRATRRPFKSSTSSARAWCGATKTGSVDSPRTMSRWTKPAPLAGERMGKAVGFTTRFSSPVPSRCVIESRASSSTTGKTDVRRTRSATPSCPTVAPSRSVGIERRPHQTRLDR